MCFFTEPGIIPKKHEKYYTKVEEFSIDNDNEINNVFIYKIKPLSQTKYDDNKEKEENQSLNSISTETERINLNTEIQITQEENTCYPDIYK